MKDQIEALREERNIARRKLANAEHRQRLLIRDQKTLERLGELLDIEFEDMTVAELVETKKGLTRAIEIMPQVEPYLLLLTVDSILDAYAKLNLHMRMHEREERIQRSKLRREREIQAQEHLCIVCQKRPRHFEDYCKRCVPEDLRPTGKIS